MARLLNNHFYFQWIIYIRPSSKISTGLSKKESYILVKDEYKDKVKKLINTKLSDDELMGAELGSAGSLTILSELVHLLINSFSNQSKTEKQLENKNKRIHF